jgi:hypothetical protein
MFYVLVGDETKGPYSIGQLQALLTSGAIQWDTLYATDGAGEWKPVTALRDVLGGSSIAVDGPLPGGRDIPAWLVWLAIAIIGAGLIYSLGDAGIVVAVIIGLLLGVPIYFIPAIVAHTSRHKNFTAICALNFFLGWTFLGWVIALVWALKRD